MKVYIFNYPKTAGDPKEPGKRHAGIIQTELETLTISQLEHSELKRVEKRGLKEKLNKNSTEVLNLSKPIEIYLDPSLPFSADDIADDFSFGNGCTIGAVRLKDNRWIPCCFFVIDKVNKVNFDNKLAQIKTICEA